MRYTLLIFLQFIFLNLKSQVISENLNDLLCSLAKYPNISARGMDGKYTRLEAAVAEDIGVNTENIERSDSVAILELRNAFDEVIKQQYICGLDGSFLFTVTYNEGYRFLDRLITVYELDLSLLTEGMEMRDLDSNGFYLHNKSTHTVNLLDYTASLIYYFRHIPRGIGKTRKLCKCFDVLKTTMSPGREYILENAWEFDYSIEKIEAICSNFDVRAKLLYELDDLTRAHRNRGRQTNKRGKITIDYDKLETKLGRWYYDEVRRLFRMGYFNFKIDEVTWQYVGLVEEGHYVLLSCVNNENCFEGKNLSFRDETWTNPDLDKVKIFLSTKEGVNRFMEILGELSKLDKD